MTMQLVMISPTNTDSSSDSSYSVALSTWSKTITSEAMIASCTMMRIDAGVWLRIRLTARFASSATRTTPAPITSALSTRVVTASAEHTPSICTPIGLLTRTGSNRIVAAWG
jgi:hypothetical protein